MSGALDEPASRGGRRLDRSVRGVQRRQFTVTLSSDEYATLRAMAENRGESMSRILVRAAMNDGSSDRIDGATLDAFLPRLVDLQMQVRGIAGNLNQLAHWANGHRAFPTEASAVAKQVRGLLVELEDVLESVRA